MKASVMYAVIVFSRLLFTAIKNGTLMRIRIVLNHKNP